MGKYLLARRPVGPLSLSLSPLLWHVTWGQMQLTTPIALLSPPAVNGYTLVLGPGPGAHYDFIKMLSAKIRIFRTFVGERSLSPSRSLSLSFSGEHSR